ncbi:hypothetical protein FRB99_000544 [Tulasnella sp. 403]|nr:hypothetical protein FRB99_000544 [Tulasnella sp. 403]
MSGVGTPVRQWLTVVQHAWDLGFTAFGGPPTHFQILHRRFVERLGWIDEGVWQELFALTQALPGPASTKMLYCIFLNKLGFLPAVLAFLFWSIPGALGMFGFSLGVSSIKEKLPAVIYALLSGLNASTVGIVAVAAVQLSERAITDPLTRAIVTATAGAGMLYNALWYFPLLMVLSGGVTVAWDLGGGLERLKRFQRWCARVKRGFRWRKREGHQEGGEMQGGIELPSLPSRLPGQEAPASEQGGSPVKEVQTEGHPMDLVLPPMPPATVSPSALTHRTGSRYTPSIQFLPLSTPPRTPPAEQAPLPPTPALHGTITTLRPDITPRTGIAIIVAFFASFITLMVLRGTLNHPPVTLKLFTNLYLAGTIIFGGGPVVIPLLREYIVTEGWVSSRDFLLGLAVIQAFPGPNFNFAVYLAALSAKATAGVPSPVTAFLGFVAIFLPGMALATATTSLFPLIRKYKPVAALLRGVNAGAVGLVWTAVYRLWEIGYLTPEATSGSSLAREPWWVVVALVTFASNRWYGVPAPVSILVGGVMGIAWWGVVKRN